MPLDRPYLSFLNPDSAPKLGKKKKAVTYAKAEESLNALKSAARGTPQFSALKQQMSGGY